MENTEKYRIIKNLAIRRTVGVNIFTRQRRHSSPPVSISAIKLKPTLQG